MENNNKMENSNKKPYELVPNFDELYNATYEYIKEHQGEKGYIDTQDEACDNISAYVYDECMGCAVEMRVHGVRANIESEDIEIVYEPIMRTYRIEYSDEDFKSEEAEWKTIRWGDIVYYSPTLLDIAENIHEYC